MTDNISDRQLDAWLATDRIDAPGDQLIHRILASAPVASAKSAPMPKPQTTAAWWRRAWVWPGAGLAGIGLAGSFAGAFAVSFVLGATSVQPADTADRATAFSAIPADWSEE